MVEKKTGGKGQGLPRGKATFESGPTTSEDGDVDNITVTRSPNDKSSNRSSIGGKRGSPFKNLDEASQYASELQRETRGMKKGGTVKSASTRADGIAQRGKTRGKMR